MSRVVYTQRKTVRAYLQGYLVNYIKKKYRKFVYKKTPWFHGQRSSHVDQTHAIIVPW